MESSDKTDRLFAWTVLGLVSIFMLFAVLSLSTCRSVPTSPAQLEAMDEAAYARLEAKACAIVRIGIGRCIEKGKLDAAKVETIANALDSFAAGVLDTEGGLLADALKRRGFTDDEVLLAFLIVEDLVAEAGMCDRLEIGPHATALLHALAKAARDATPTTEPIPE